MTGDTTTALASQRPRGSWLKRQVQLHAYVGETILLVGVMATLNLGLLPAYPGFMSIEPNPLFAVILLMAARYGFRAGLLSALLSAGTYYGLVATRVGTVAPRDLLLWSYAKPAVLFIVVGVIVGILVQRSKDRIARLEKENNLLAKDNATLKRGEAELRDVNVELANRVVGANETLPILYKYAKRLNSLDVDEIYSALTELVMEVIKAEQVSVYHVDGKRLVLHSRNGRRAASGPSIELKLDPVFFDRVVNKRTVFTLHDLLARNIRSRDLFLCGPLGAEGGEGTAEAVLAVELLEFLRYNPATIRLFNVVIDWAGDSISQASRYSSNPEERRLQENKRALLRAQRAGDATGILEVPAVDLNGRGHPLQLGATRANLSQIMSDAEQQLFGEGDATIHDERIPDLDPRNVLQSSAAGSFDVAAGQAQQRDTADRAALQHLLSGELQIASSQGNRSLTRLLAEIDDYISGADVSGDSETSGRGSDGSEG